MKILKKKLFFKRLTFLTLSLKKGAIIYFPENNVFISAPSSASFVEYIFFWREKMFFLIDEANLLVITELYNTILELCASYQPGVKIKQGRS